MQRVWALVMTMGISVAALAQTSQAQPGTYDKSQDPAYTHKLPTCRQQVGLKTARRYESWCMDFAETRHPLCNVLDRCSVILSYVAAECDRRQSDIDHHVKGDPVMPYCAEAERVYELDSAQDDRLEKEHYAYVAKHPGKPMTYEEWLKLLSH